MPNQQSALEEDDYTDLISNEMSEEDYLDSIDSHLQIIEKNTESMRDSLIFIVIFISAVGITMGIIAIIDFFSSK